MKIALILAVGLAALTSVGTAASSSWPSDPRVCSYLATEGKAGCARDNAVGAMRRHVGGTTGFYQGATACTQQRQATVLRWSCTAGGTPYLVVFTRAKGRWWVNVTP